MTDREWRFDLDELDDADDRDESESFAELTVGAWREALDAEGTKRVVLVGLLLWLTVVPVVLLVVMVLAMLGVL